MTLEELEIVVKANVEQATEQLEDLKDQLSEKTTDGFKNITKEADKMGEQVADTGKEIGKMIPQLAATATKAATGSTAMAGFGKAVATASMAVQTAVPVLLVISGVIILIYATIKKLIGIVGKIKTIVATSINVISKLLQGLERQISNVFSIMQNLAKRGINNLVQVSAKLNESLSELKSSVTQFGNALATAVAPVVIAVTPMLVRLLEIVTNVANGIAQITASLFGGRTTYQKAIKVNENYAKSINGVNKAVKGTLASFDELNVISEQSSGGGSVNPLEMFEEVPIDEKIQELTKELSELWNTDNIEGLRNFGSRLGAKVKEQIESIPAGDWGRTLGTKINNGLALVNGFLQERPFIEIGTKIAEFLLGMVETIDPEELGLAIANVIMEAVGVVRKFVEKMTQEDGWKKIGDWLATTLNNLFRNIKPEELGQTISGLVTGILDLLIEFFQKAEWEVYAKQIFDTLKNIDWGDIIEKLVTFIYEMWKAKQTFRLMILGLISLEFEKWVFEKIVGLGKKIVEWFSPYIELIKTIIETVKETVKEVINSIQTTLTGILVFISGVFTGDWDKAWNGIKIAFEGIWDGMKAIAKGTVNVIIDVINAMVKNASKGINDFIKKINFAIAMINEMTGSDFKLLKNINYTDYTIPHLAKGGIIDKPTTIMAGEYAGASQNPEIVAPQRLLLETSTQANVPVMNAIEEMGDKMVAALNNIGVYAEFDYSKLKVGLDNENYRVGGKLYGI